MFRRLSVQPLEDRAVPAGNVAAAVFEGVLYLQGDDAGNQLWIQVSGDHVSIQPMDATTTINGAPGLANFDGVSRGYYGLLAGGDDVVVVDGTSGNKSLFLDTGDGNDRVMLQYDSNTRGTNIQTGAGDDFVGIGGSDLGGTTTVSMGDGNDTADFGWTTFRNVAADGGTGTNSLLTPQINVTGTPFSAGFTVVTSLSPVAAADTASVTAGSSVSINVAANDQAVQGTLDLTSVAITTQPTLGTVSVGTDGTVNYTSTGTTAGTDTFQYTIKNSGGAVSAPATVTVAVGAAPVTTAPTVNLTTTTTSPSKATSFQYTATFSEDVTGFSDTGVTVTGGTVGTVTQVDARTYTFAVSPVTDGSVVVSVAAGAAHDAAGNANTASDPVTVISDTTNPAVTANSLTTSSTTPTLTGTVNDSSATTVQVSVGGQSITAAVSGTTWSAAVPTALADGSYTIDVTATDGAGNVGTTSLANGLVIDSTAPTLTLTTPASDPTNANSFTVTATFSEAVTGFDASDVTPTNGAVSAFTAVDGKTYTFVVTPAADGSVGVSVAAGAATDTAGNGSAAANLSRTSDKTAPAVAVDPTGTQVITGTTSDATSGVAGVKVSISNGTDFWDGTGFTATVEQFFDATVTGGTWSLPFTTGGTFTIHAQARDNAGNLGNSTGSITVT
jgi:hypothetical protein